MREYLEHLERHFLLPLDNPVLIFSLILVIILVAPILLNKIRIPGIIWPDYFGDYRRTLRTSIARGRTIC